jgi:hypothetical protein
MPQKHLSFRLKCPFSFEMTRGSFAQFQVTNPSVSLPQNLQTIKEEVVFAFLKPSGSTTHLLHGDFEMKPWNWEPGTASWHSHLPQRGANPGAIQIGLGWSWMVMASPLSQALSIASGET